MQDKETDPVAIQHRRPVEARPSAAPARIIVDGGAWHASRRHQQWVDHLEELGKRGAWQAHIRGERAEICALEFEEDVTRQEADGRFDEQSRPCDAELIVWALNHARDFLRRERRIRSHEVPMPSGVALERILAANRPPRGTDPQEELERKEMAAMLETALAKLTDQQREIFLLRCVVQEEFADIAS